MKNAAKLLAKLTRATKKLRQLELVQLARLRLAPAKYGFRSAAEMADALRALSVVQRAPTPARKATRRSSSGKGHRLTERMKARMLADIGDGAKASALAKTYRVTTATAYRYIAIATNKSAQAAR